MSRVMRGRARSSGAGEDREGSGAADMMSLYTTVPTKGAGALGPRRKRPAGPSFPGGEGRLARSASGGGDQPRSGFRRRRAGEAPTGSAPDPTRLDPRSSPPSPEGRYGIHTFRFERAGDV